MQLRVRYLDRRGYIRVPVSGPVRWQSGRREGTGELVDLSPGGVGVRMPLRSALQLKGNVAVWVELGGGERFWLARVAEVARHAPSHDGTCTVGLRVREQDGEAQPAAARRDAERQTGGLPRFDGGKTRGVPLRG